MSRRLTLPLLVLCFLIAAILRLPDLSTSPPGLHFDEAANGILAADIGLRGERPIFISSYTGKETLFFYLAGFLMRLLGDSVFTLRLAAAFIGLLTVAATYWLGVELTRDRRVALVAAVLLAISFWHLLFSRLGFRAISQPLLQALTVAALFRGLRRFSWSWIVIGGIALGLTAYTYLAARLFPIPLALSLIPFLFDHPYARRRRNQLVVFASVGLLVLSPLLVTFMANPESFWVRVDQVLPGDQLSTTLLTSYWKSIGMFLWDGDPYWRFNIPGRPLFDWFWGGLFILGWLVTLLRWPRYFAARQKAANLLLLLVPPLMLLPTALAVGEIVPSNLRAIGLLPFVLYLPASGLFILLQFLYDRIRPAWQRLKRLPGAGRAAERKWTKVRWSLADFFTPAVLLLLFVGGLTTRQTYFRDWVTRTDLFYEADADLVAVTQYLNESDTSGMTVYLAALHYRHPTVAFLSDRYDQVKWLPESQAFPVPVEGPVMYLFPRNSPRPDWAAAYLPAEPTATGPAGPDGEPTFEAYTITTPPIVDPPIDVQANFSNVVTLLGFEVGSGSSGGTLPLTLYWRVESAPPAAYQPFIHLEDAWKVRWGQVEPFAYPAEQWAVGDTVVQRVDVPLRPGMPPGMYRIKVGFFEPDGGRQLARLDSAGRYAGNALAIEGVVVNAGTPPSPLPQPPNILDSPAGPGLTLMGYERAEEKVSSGAPFGLALWWLADRPLEPMSTRLELFRQDNVGQILLNSRPVHNSYFFDSWSTLQFVIDHLTARIPLSLPPGEYLLSLRLLDREDETIMTTDLGPLTVETAEHLFEPPRTQHPLAATFGNEIQLLGYDLVQIEPRRHELTLVWQAQTEPLDGYTVFVHLLNQDGSCCVWQQDISPQQGAYPTNYWLSGEVIVDKYTIDLPPELEPGPYALEIGLFVPESGLRLVISIPGLRDSDALLLWPLMVE